MFRSWLTVSVVLVAATALAQQQLPAQQPHAHSTDNHIAGCLILGNEEEVALGQFAQQQAASDQVKAFAGRMVDDHTKAATDLRQFAPPGVDLAIQHHLGGQPTQQTAVGGQQPQAAARAGNPILQIERDAKEQCLIMTENELKQHRGAEFDKAYMNQQLVGHVQMIANLTASENYASPELQKVIRQQRQTAEQHLEHVRQTLQALKLGSESAQHGAVPHAPHN